MKGGSGLGAHAALHLRHLHSGLGGGNIGEELMGRPFWDQLPAAVTLEVEVARWADRHREPYPSSHRYVWVGRRMALRRWAGWLRPGPRPAAALLSGSTPIAETEGLGMMRHVGTRVRRAAADGLPVDAVGTGVEPLRSPEAVAVFRAGFAAVRTWTVRSEPCRQALLALGVPPERVRVGADWAWLHRPRRDRMPFATKLWRSLGIDPDRPLLVANLVNQIWSGCHDAKRAIATALDRAATDHGLQIAFQCNDSRSGAGMDDEAAREVMCAMRQPAVLVPTAYYSPAEAVALLERATVTVGQRYHFIIETVLTGTAVPVVIPRLQKMASLVAELGCLAAGSIDRVDADDLAGCIGQAVEQRAAWLAHLAARRTRLAARAATNLDLLWRQPPYDRLEHPEAARAA